MRRRLEWRESKGNQLLEAKDLNTKLVFDLVYNPLETPLLRMARQKGIPIITGIEMFVQQGARQFEIFTGKPAPEEEMLRVVIHALRQQAEALQRPLRRPRKHLRPTGRKHLPPRRKKRLKIRIFQKKMRPRCEPGFCCFCWCF